MRIPLMQRLISSLAIVSLSLFPSSVLAQQHFGGVFYQPHHNNWQQNQFGGDTVIYDGRVLTNNLPPNTDTCGWVRSQGLSCQYERWDENVRTHFVRSINNSWGNGWNNNSRNRYNHYQRHPVPILNGGSNCLIFCVNN
jgi:hypothetical protein